MYQEIGLSKSKYCKGFQCPKILWLNKYKPEVGEDVLPEAVLANGNMVGDLARGYYGDYSLVEFSNDKKAMCDQTLKYIDDGAINIAEASFIYDGLYCAVDILHKDEDGWDIVEVKSSTHVSPIYEEDMSFQYYVLTKCGINVKKVFNMHINNKYVRHGDLNLKGLFNVIDYTDSSVSRFASVEKNIADIRAYVIDETERHKDIGIYCHTPYDCAYWKYCSKHVPEKSVFNVSRLQLQKKYDLYHKGIISYSDLFDNSYLLNAKQKLQVETDLKDLPEHIEKNEIKKFLDTLTYPIYHLDFETYQEAIPKFEGGVPYSQIPFQYSLHIEHEDGTLEHKEFLAKEGTDPRRALAESLCNDIPKDVCSLAYNMSFERRVILQLSEDFPDLAEHLLNIRDNMHDLMIPFSKGYYYSKDMQGSYSIKYVLPAIYPDDPELDYHNLDGVHNGSEASNAFATMTEHTEEEIKEIRKNLLKYCGLDTFAMVKVLGYLKKVSN